MVTELFFIGNEAGQNNASWFYIQSLAAAWFLFFLFLIKLEHKKSAYRIVAIFAFMISIPSTAQFLHLRNSDNYVDFGPGEMAMVDRIAATEPHSVFLHPLNEDRPSLASNLAGRPTVLSAWVSFVTENEQLSERAEDVQIFFSQETLSPARQGILSKYRVDYVYAEADTLLFMDDLPNVQQEFKSGKWVLYRVFR